jgi:hypothetical protein
MKVIQAIWSFRRKRLPGDWSIQKWKSRLCPHCGQQVEGVNYWDTYAPVVTWSTVRLVMIMSLLSELHTKQVDYVQAYVQADLDAEIYINIRRGFHVVNGKLKFNMDSPADHDKAHVLKLKKKAYGPKQGGHLFWKKLRDGLTKRGFVQSEIDQCLFLRGDAL